jgi:hypothetical protein
MPTLRGPFCRLCIQPPPVTNGTRRRLYYVGASENAPARCTGCNDGKILSAFGNLAAVVSGALVLIAIAVAVHAYMLQDSVKSWLRFSWRACRVQCKILLGFYMIAPKVPRIYDVSLPADLLKVLARFEVTLDLSIFHTPLECLGHGDFLSRLQFWMAVPPAAVILVVLLSACAECRNGLPMSTRHTLPFVGRVIEYSTPWALRIMFLSYPTVTNVAFSAFSCYEFETGDSWLISDVSIRCNSHYHTNVVAAWALAAVAIYPLGLVLVCAMLLVLSQKAVRTGEPTRLSTAIAFLHNEYRTMCFWWELMEMLRRFVLLGLLAFYPTHGSLAQIAIGTLLCLVYLFVQMQASPYRGIRDDYIGKVASFFLLMYFGCCFVFKVLERLERPEYVAIQTASQRRLDRLPMIGVITFGTAFGVTVISAIIVVVQVREERDRRRQDARAAKARRLRFIDSHKEVTPPLLRVGLVYHVFLSHVWGTGQDQMRVVKQRLLEMIPELRVFLDVDDLDEISNLEGYIEETDRLLVHLSKGYFESKNCMRELTTAARLKKHVIAILDPDSSHGGLSKDEVHEHLCQAASMYDRWGFMAEAPSGEALFDHVFAHEPIEWDRIGVRTQLPTACAPLIARLMNPERRSSNHAWQHFQDVTMRLIAEQVVLPEELQGSVMVHALIENSNSDTQPA